MTDSIFAESLATVHRGHAAGKNAVEKAASQLVSDVKYKVNQELGPNTNLNPAQVAQKYQQKLSASKAPPSVKAIATKKLMGEEYTSDVKERVQNSLVDVLSKVFVEGIDEEIQNTEYELQLEEIQERKYWVVVTDKKTGNTYRRRATRAKIAELRSNPNIARVEMTHYHPNEKDDERGQKTAKVKSGKGLDPVGREDADVNNDRKVDKTDKYLQNRRNVRGAAIAAKRGVAEEFIGEVKNTKTKKEVTGKGVNNYGGKGAVVKVFPNMQEQSQMMSPDKNQKPVKDVVDSNEKRQISTLQQFQRREQQLNQQKIAAQKAGKVPVGSVQMNSHEPEGEDIQEVSPPGFKGTVKAMKKHKEIDNPYALAWHMKKKGYKSHKKASGAMKEETCGCADGKEPKLKKSEGGVEDPREIPTKVNLAKNKLRAMGAKNPLVMVASENVESGPILPGEKGKRVFPKGQEPKPTGAKLPKLQNAHYEPEGDLVDEATRLFYKLQKKGRGRSKTAQAQLKSDADLETQKNRKMKQQQTRQRQERESEENERDHGSMSATERNPNLR